MEQLSLNSTRLLNDDTFTYIHVSVVRNLYSHYLLELSISACSHLKSTVLSAMLKLTDEDLTDIQSVLERAKGPSGEVYGLERESEGVHSRIMRYNLSQVNQGAHLEELTRRYIYVRTYVCMYVCMYACMS